MNRCDLYREAKNVFNCLTPSLLYPSQIFFALIENGHRFVETKILLSHTRGEIGRSIMESFELGFRRIGLLLRLFDLREGIVERNGALEDALRQIERMTADGAGLV